MSTMKKRIPMFLLALAMMVAMAVPAFAAPSYTVSPDPSGSSSSNYMNLHGNSSSVSESHRLSCRRMRLLRSSVTTVPEKVHLQEHYAV